MKHKLLLSLREQIFFILLKDDGMKVLFLILLVLLAGKSSAAELDFAVTTLKAPGVDSIDLTLDEIVTIALQYNRNIKDREFAVKSNRLSLGASRNIFDIKIKPLSSINYSSENEEEVTVWQAGGSVSKIFQTGITVDLKPSIAKGDSEYDMGVGFSLAVPLLRGFGSDVVLNNIYSSEFALIKSARTLHRQRVNTMLETIATVYSLVKEQQLIDLYNNQIKQLKNHLKFTLIKERIGLARSMDIYRAEIRIREVGDSLNFARERVENAMDRLKTILAFPLEQSLLVRAPLMYSFVTLGLDEAVSIALKNRLEINQANADISEAVRRSKVAYQNTLPEINLEATYTRRGRSSEFDRLFILDEDLFFIGLTSTTDFARSAEKSGWAQSKIVVDREYLLSETVKESIIGEVRRVMNSMEKAENRIMLRREQITHATGKLRFSQVKFQHGEADNFDLIESQVQLQRAKANLVSDEILYIINGYRLRATMGTLLEFKGI